MVTVLVTCPWRIHPFDGGGVCTAWLTRTCVPATVALMLGRQSSPGYQERQPARLRRGGGCAPAAPLVEMSLLCRPHARVLLGDGSHSRRLVRAGPMSVRRRVRRRSPGHRGGAASRDGCRREGRDRRPG